MKLQTVISPSTLWISAGAAWVLLVLCSCESSGSGAKVAPSSNSTLGEAARDAEVVAAQEPGRQAMQGSGDSMAPVMGDNSLVVVHPIEYEELKEGMMVAYRDNQGRRIVHRLVQKRSDGWLAQGVNNNIPDTELVTRENLLGVVYATFLFSDEDVSAPQTK